MPQPSFFRLLTNSTPRNQDILQKAQELQYTIVWSHGEQQFNASCLQFPQVSYFAGTRDEALEGAKQEVVWALEQ